MILWVREIKNMRRKFFLLLVVGVLIFGTTGCIKLKKSGTTKSNLGGVFMTDDRFETWKNRSNLMTPGETPGTISDTDIYLMRFDPSDQEAMYAATRGDGLFYSYNRGLGWMKSSKLPAGLVYDIVINTKDKCTLYAAVSNNIFKSEDCARNWKQMYFTDSSEKIVSALQIDWYNPTIIYAGLSDGSFLQTSDGGQSWKMLEKFPSRVKKIVVDSFDSRRLYVGVSGTGLYKKDIDSDDWTGLNKAMKDFSGAKKYYDFEVSESKENLILYANKYGVLRSLDGGLTWAEVKLVTPPGAEVIYSLEIDPTNENYIYYSTNSAIYKTLDGGENWVIKQMPTTRVAGEIMVHPKETANIFVGAKFVEQK